MTGQLWEIPMSLVNGLRQYKVGHIVACTWLLSSCGGSGEGTGPAYAYVANEGTLSTYSINPSTGGLTASAGSPLSFPTGWPFAGISQIATDPSGQFLYLLDYSGVYAYAINRNTGALTAVAGSPFDAGSTPTSLAFAASGSYLYVTGDIGPIAPVKTVISAYSVSNSGALVPLAKYTVSSALNTAVVAGNYLYVAGYYTNSITVFSIGSSGKLSQNVPGSPFPTDTGPYSIVADPSASVLYTANNGVPTGTEATPGSISAFTINSSTGALTPVPGNPQPIAAQGSLSLNPIGEFLLVPERIGVAVYGIDTATGALSAAAGSPFVAGTAPSVVSVDPTGRFVYVVNNGSNNVSEFKLESTGALTPLAGSPVPVENNPGDMAIVWQ
jgi:6-phosphogluconolactonase (cycloisomerase 2 family)